MLTPKEMIIGLLEGKQVEHSDNEWYLVRAGKYVAADGQTYDLSKFRYDELQGLLIWGSRDPQ